ncbi:MAG: SpoIIE family protein phosphatase [Candidatus Krumholzibacteria bacterium]|nr:SpoIIE family protein phosphatase [Candidatus Krumholzibacteria bacterium]
MTAKQDDLGRLEEENRRLKSAVEELSIINDISTAINSTLSLEKIIELIVQKCIKHLKVQQGTVTLLESGGSENQFRTIMRKADQTTGYMPLHLDTQISGWMLVNKKPLVIDDLESDDRFRTFDSDGNLFRTLLSVPLFLKGRIIGSINVFNKHGGEPFADADKRLLSIIATQSAQVIENARLYEEEQSLMRMREELEIAYNIQTSLLPQEPPAIDGYDIAGRSIPAASVGGDYFDLIRLCDGRLFFCLGDISGKGMPAALLMSNMLATLRGQDLDGSSPSKILERSNHQMYRSTDPERFSTLLLGILDPGEHMIRYGNAGHNLPILVRGDGAVERLTTGDLVLGALDEITFHEDTVSIGPGDTLLIFSDGISEAINVEDEEFGEERICGLIADHRNGSAQRLVEEIVIAVGAHAGKMPQRDDVTMVVIKRL